MQYEYTLAGGSLLHLNHLNLAVDDVAAASSFLETYFGLTPLEGAPATSRIRILRDDAGCAVALMHLPNRPPVAYPDTFHIGFIQIDRDAVNQIHARLTADGFRVDPPRRLHGSWTFYIPAPGGVLIEVLA